MLYIFWVNSIDSVNKHVYYKCENVLKIIGNNELKYNFSCVK